jgi:hypothetical protein
LSAFAFAFLEAGVGVVVECCDGGDVVWIIGDFGEGSEGAFAVGLDLGAALVVVFVAGCGGGV